MGERTERVIARNEAHSLRHFRRNYMAHAVEGGLYMAGLTFVAFETVLPPVIKSLGGPAWLISLAPALSTLGFAIPPLFTAHLLEPLTRKLPVVAWNGVFIRIPFLVAALCLFFLAESHPMLTLAAVAAAPFLNGFINGMVCPAWFELFAKTVPVGRRASLFAVRLVIAGAGGLIAGEVISLALKAHPGPAGYGILHLCCFLFLMGSLMVFITIKETPMPQLDLNSPRTLKASLAEVPRIIRSDANFRGFLLARTFASAPYAAFPFLSIHALETLRLPESYLGSFFIAFTVGSMIGNVFSGYIGDQTGGRIPFLVTMILYMFAFGAAIFASNLLGFLMIFGLAGFCRDAMNVAASTLMAEIPPPKRRLKYLAVTMALLAPGMLFAPLLGVAAWSLGKGSYAWPATLSIMLLSVALYMIYRMKEPRDEPWKGGGRKTEKTP
jgi:MFS family permease